MNVAHFIQRYPPALGGSEAYFARLSRFLSAHGDAVTVFTTNAVALDAFWDRHGRCIPAGSCDDDGVTVRRYPLLRWPARRWCLKPLSLVPHRLWQCLTLPCNPIAPAMWRDCGRALAVDVVHASAFPYAWPIACGLRLARKCGVPFLLTPFLHLGDPDDPHDRTRKGYLSPPLRWLLRQADGIFVQTPSERDAVLGLGIDPERVQLQGLGVDETECTGGDRERARRAWGVAPGEVVVGHLANNSREKGTNDLLQAAAGLPVRVVLAGPEMPNFRAFWDGFADRQQVIRLGPLTDDQKRDFFAGIDVFALPSRSDSFGLVLLEAWANGVPNVGYRAGGIADVIRHGEDGLLAGCGEIGELREALGLLGRDAGLRLQMGAAGKARLRRDFVWREKLEMVRAAYGAARARSRKRVGG